MQANVTIYWMNVNMSKTRARKGYAQDSSDARVVLFGSEDEPTNANEASPSGARGHTRDERGIDAGDTVDAGRCWCRPPTPLLPMLGLMLTANTVNTRCTINWGDGTRTVADMVKKCLPFVVVDTGCGGGGDLDRQWMAVDDVVKGYLPLPLRSPSSSWSKGMIVVVVNI